VQSHRDRRVAGAQRGIRTQVAGRYIVENDEILVHIQAGLCCFPDDRKFEVVRQAIAHFARAHHVIDLDGARVEYGDGWGLIRASNTEPALVLRFEAKTEDRLKEIEGEMRGWLKTATAASAKTK